MQSILNWFSDNHQPMYLVLAAGIALIFGLIVLIYRSITGGRIRVPGAARTRQPRLGVVDAYDLDRERQLVLIRRDNVEHLIMIGGPNDVVIETQVIRVEARARDKDLGSSLAATNLSTLPVPPILPAAERDSAAKIPMHTAPDAPIDRADYSQPSQETAAAPQVGMQKAEPTSSPENILHADELSAALAAALSKSASPSPTPTLKPGALAEERKSSNPLAGVLRSGLNAVKLTSPVNKVGTEQEKVDQNASLPPELPSYLAESKSANIPSSPLPAPHPAPRFAPFERTNVPRADLMPKPAPSKPNFAPPPVMPKPIAPQKPTEASRPGDTNATLPKQPPSAPPPAIDFESIEEEMAKLLGRPIPDKK